MSSSLIQQLRKIGRPLLAVIHTTLLLSASSMSSIHCALQTCFGEASQSHDTTKPLQLTSSHHSQKFFISAKGSMFDEVTNFLVGDVICIWNVQDVSIATHFQCQGFSFKFNSESPCFAPVEEY